MLKLEVHGVAKALRSCLVTDFAGMLEFWLRSISEVRWELKKTVTLKCFRSVILW